MPQNKDLKRLVRARMAETGENYTQALAHVLGQTELEALPAAWHITGSHRRDYEVGLLPTTVTYDGNRVAQLRLRSGVSEPAGFGALMSGAGAMDIAGPRFEEAGDAAPTKTTTWQLPEEPQALDFTAAPAR